jgi:catalase
LEADATCDVGIFDPNNLVEGIEAPKNDKVLPMRSLDYAVSFGRRTN